MTDKHFLKEASLLNKEEGKKLYSYLDNYSISDDDKENGDPKHW